MRRGEREEGRGNREEGRRKPEMHTGQESFQLRVPTSQHPSAGRSQVEISHY